MNKLEYTENVLADAMEWIDENIEYCDDFSSAFDDMELTITGNDNGSYYCNSRRAEEALEGIIFDEEINNAMRDYGYESLPLYKGAEACDVIVRIVILNELYAEVEDYFNEKKGE